MKILTISDKKEESFLRQKIDKLDFETRLIKSDAKCNRKEINELIKQMRETMRVAEGVGLSANQIGLNLRVFVAQLPQTQMNADKNTDGHGYSGKFYIMFNPEIIKFSKEKTIMEEGCLSAPGMSGLVERSEKITLVGQDKNGKKIKIKAWGLLARIFQHEVDHLNGVLFIDKAKNIQKTEAQSKI